MNYDTPNRLQPNQQRVVIENFQSDDPERRKDADAVCFEHELTIRDVADMAANVRRNA